MISSVMFLLLGLATGSLAAFIFTLEPGYRVKGIRNFLLLWAGIFVYLTLDADIDLGGFEPSIRFSFAAALGLTSLTMVKHLRIAIDELEYIAYVSVLLFIIGFIGEWWWPVLFIPVFMIHIIPLLTQNVLSKSSRLMYYISYSFVSLFIFATLFWSGIHIAVTNLPYTTLGVVQSLIIGWVLYIYLVHATFIVSLLNPRVWGSVQNIHVHFNFTRRYPAIFLLLTVIICVVSLWMLIQFVTLLNAVIFFSSLVFIVNYSLHKYHNQQYLFTPKSIFKK